MTRSTGKREYQRQKRKKIPQTGLVVKKKCREEKPACYHQKNGDDDIGYRRNKIAVELLFKYMNDLFHIISPVSDF